MRSFSLWLSLEDDVWGRCRVRLLGVKIQGGFSSEARVFARLLGHRGSAFDAQVLYHAHDGAETWREFEAVAQAPLHRFDAGYREQMSSMAAKAAALLSFRRRLGGLSRLARAYRPNIVYSSQQFWDCAAASHIAKRLRVPHAIHLHYVVGPWLSTGFSRNPNAMLMATRSLGLDDPVERLRSSEQVIAVSDFIRHDAIAQGVPPDRITTIRNPVPELELSGSDGRAIRAALELPPGAPVIGIVGRFDVGKGHLDTLKAFAQCLPKHPEAYLLMVGGGPLEADLRSEATKLGVAGRVRFTGWRSDVPALLNAMDVFAHPSRREPFGLAVAEASAAGLPVVAYADGAIGEIVLDRETGLLVPFGDIPQLAIALDWALARPDEARKMGMRGRERIQRCFAPHDAARQLTEVLHRVVEKQRSGALA